MYRYLISLTVLVLSTAHGAAPNTQEALGQALYFDPSLSKNRTQSCATCHSPEHGFIDPRTNAAGRAVSSGDDGVSLGDRNTPTASYAAFSPRFHRNAAGDYIGGQFLDGRANDLQDQAGGPPLNPVEMGMPDKMAIIQRIQENPVYVKAFKALYGEDVFSDAETAYQAMTDSIQAFERTDLFSPFDAKYDRYLRGEYQMTDQEELGMTLFFSEQFTNCHLCHQLRSTPHRQRETFTDYSYHNIGVPANQTVRQLNGLGVKHQDQGLLDNPKVTDPQQAGKFKTPTLRNVAVTGPYMHNGVFKDLRTVVLFYNQYNSRSPRSRINPETGETWQPAEIPENLSLKELKTGPALDDRRIDALVAFMQTLTDRRYEK